METEKCMGRATCFDCIYAINDYDATYCREASRVISDEQGYGDIKICEKFRRLAYGNYRNGDYWQFYNRQRQYG